ncbi:MAG: roadblock/LC7 domain-containing protein [Planctomycetes bacterium]|nr:roadblock/LC7 domain-containing protein [Planctomycetota bacterium]
MRPDEERTHNFMALFDFFKNWRSTSKIKGLEAQLQGRPTPQVYLELAEAYEEADNPQRAAQILKLGVARFPSSPEIGRRKAEVEKVERESEKRRLKEKIQTHPNPILYARLAELYKADSEIDQCIQICQAGIKAFPRYGGTYLVLGQIYIEKQKWEEAQQNLEKSVELDKYNYMALKLLAQVYMQLGRPADSARRLEDILYFAPGDEAILELLRKARETAGEVAATADTQDFKENQRGKGVPTPATSNSRTKIVGRLADQQARSTAGARDRVLNDGIQNLRQVAGVTGALLVDQYGLVVAADLDSTLDEGLAGALITNVYRTSSDNSIQLGVGTFEEGMIEGEMGNIHIVQFGDMILAVFAKHDVKMGLLEKAIRDFASQVAQSQNS